MCKKRCHLTRKDKELDLEQIMDEADKDKLPDLVINKGTSSDSLNKLDLFHGKTLKTPNLPVPRHVTRSSLLSSWSSVQADITSHSEALVPKDNQLALPGVTDSAQDENTSTQPKLTENNNNDNDNGSDNATPTTEDLSSSVTPPDTPGIAAKGETQMEDNAYMDTDEMPVSTTNIDTKKTTFVRMPTVHGVTEQNNSSLRYDSEHGRLDTNEMLPVIMETLLGITNKDNIDHAYHRQDSHSSF